MAIYFEISELNININAYLKSEKYLIIIFLALTAMVNAVLLFKTICCRRCGMPDNPGTTRGITCSIRISLALAGFILAFFTDVVNALLIFEQQDHNLSCLTTSLSGIFEKEFLPVLYACGLVLITADVIYQSKVDSTLSTRGQDRQFKRPVCFSVACGVFPWVISLLIVCPLTLSSVDWTNNCRVEQSKFHTEARMIMCNVFPAVVVLVAGQLTMTWRTGSFAESDADTRYEFPMYQSQGDIYASEDIRTQHGGSTAGREVSSLNFSNTGYYSKYTGTPSSRQGPYTLPIYDLPELPEKSRGNSERSEEKSHPLQTYKCLLFISCVIFIVSVVPYNGICLYIMENYDHLEGINAFVYKVETSLFIAVNVLMWLQLVYPVLLPLLWVSVSA